MKGDPNSFPSPPEQPLQGLAQQKPDQSGSKHSRVSISCTSTLSGQICAKLHSGRSRWGGWFWITMCMFIDSICSHKLIMVWKLSEVAAVLDLPWLLSLAL